MGRWLGIAVFAAALAGLLGQAAAAEEALWQGLRSGSHVAMMRHALAPGTGDPGDFEIGDCRTQRNLSAEGRAQAERIGERFRANGIETARVLTSQWCRCRDTAALLGLGPVGDFEVLNSFFREPARGDAQTRALRDWLVERDRGAPLVLVTHQVNITALTDIFPRSGEIIVLRPEPSGAVTVVGRIATD